jgi:peptidoglycan/xylan/chitin deacetylase (PgdA/CDA1 family)
LNKIKYLVFSLWILLISCLSALSQDHNLPFQVLHGAIVRGDSSKQDLSLVFTGDEYADGGEHIARVLHEQNVKGSFFFTGRFYRNPDFRELIQTLLMGGHYLGAHSDHHLLYCSWEKRDSLLVSRKEFMDDLEGNYRAMKEFGISRNEATFFLPPYEWYNDSIAAWCLETGLQLVNITYGTLSHADYTLPGSSAYRSSLEIYESILDYEKRNPAGLNGFILLIHTGTSAERTDKFYFYLERLIRELKDQAYRFKRIDELLKHNHI